MSEPDVTFRWFAEPRGPLHLGDRGDRASTDLIPRSDTLFGAVVATAFLTGHCPDWLPAREGDSGRVLFSSLFPAWDEVLFLPRPYVRAKIGDDPSRQKAFGKVQFVSQRVFGQMLEGAPLSFEPHLLVGDRFLLHPDDLPGDQTRWQRAGHPPIRSIIEIDTVPGNVLDRATSAADTFRRAIVRVNTAEKCRFWGLVRCPESIGGDVRSALETLGDFGLGGLRSIGFGAFSVVHFEPLASDDSLAPLLAGNGPDATHLCLLSLYHPTQGEVEAGVIDEKDSHVAYDAVRRGGWIWSAGDTGLRKHTIRMLTEGSVVRRVGNGSLGDIVDVAPAVFHERPRSHPVLRNGRAVALAFTPREVKDG